MLTNYVHSTDYSVEIGPLNQGGFQGLLTEFAASKKVIIVDEGTHEYCLEYLTTQFEGLEEAEVIMLPQGEQNKVMEVCLQVWEALSDYYISRGDLIINLGGGLVTDMGGFIASLYKRGLRFVNIPTSLLAMTDASIGGKTGIDLGPYKNQLGVFSFPLKVYVDAHFLETLPLPEKVNGYAEMLKHGLIADRAHWEELKQLDFENISPKMIATSISIKNELVKSDPKEIGERKKLNYGHTFGHAIEGFYLTTESPMAHGHAVAIGMLLEAFVSMRLGFLSLDELNEIEQLLCAVYPMLIPEEEHFALLIQLMKQDKKNNAGKIKTVALKKIGESIYDVEIESSMIHEALLYVKGLSE